MAQTQIIYGFHSINAALDKHPENILNLYCQEKEAKERLKSVLDKAKNAGITIETISATKLEKLTESDHHQGLAARIRTPEPLNEKDLIQWLKSTDEKPLLLILEGIEDPHNLGACLRSAEALGVHWVILPSQRSTPITPLVSKVACGADQTLSIALVGNLVRLIEQIKQEGVWVIGTSGEATRSLSDVNFKGPTALVMGAEGKGLRRLTLETCDDVVKIPLTGAVESLNVSVATGICLYECIRQRVVIP